MSAGHSHITVHMAASLDGFIARPDGSVDWMETGDAFEGGETLEPEFVQEFLKSIDCYLMGSRTYETALGFEAAGFGWAYGDKPVFVLTRRTLPKSRDTIEFVSGDLVQLLNGRLRITYDNIWVAGGGALAGELLRLGLVDEIAYTITPVLIGDGIPFFQGVEGDIRLHLVEVKTYKSGMVAMRHQVRT